MDHLKAIRYSKGWNQAQVAKKIGVTQQTYANYENGHTQAPYETLSKLAEIYDVTIDYLLGNKINRNTSTQAGETSNLNNASEQKDLIQGVLVNPDYKQGKMSRLKAIRYSKGWNQSQVAKKIGVTQPTYANYENGHTQAPYETLSRLAEIYDVTVDYLLGNETKESTLPQPSENSDFDSATPVQKELIKRILESSDRICNRISAYMDVITDRELTADLLKFKNIDL